MASEVIRFNPIGSLSLGVFQTDIAYLGNGLSLLILITGSSKEMAMSSTEMEVSLIVLVEAEKSSNQNEKQNSILIRQRVRYTVLAKIV